MTFPEAIRLLVTLYKRSLTQANGATVDLSRELIAPTKPGTREPRNFKSDADEIADRVIRLARIAEKQYGSALKGRHNEPSDRHHPVKRATRAVILDEAGKPAEELAFLYKIHQSSVERIRREAGKDPSDGTTAEGRTLTEPPRETLRRRATETQS